MNRKLLTAVALAAAPLFAAGFTSNAMATVKLELTSGLFTTGVLVGAPCGTGSCVSFSGSVGAWTINLTSGFSDGPGNPTMDLSSLNATGSGSADPLEIELSDNGFSVGSSLFLLAASGHIVSGSGTATYSAYFDAGNTDFAKTTLIGTLGSLLDSLCHEYDRRRDGGDTIFADGGAGAYGWRQWGHVEHGLEYRAGSRAGIAHLVGLGTGRAGIVGPPPQGRVKASDTAEAGAALRRPLSFGAQLKHGA